MRQIECPKCGGECLVPNPDWEEDNLDSPEEIECDECNGYGFLEEDDEEPGDA